MQKQETTTIKEYIEGHLNFAALNGNGSIVKEATRLFEKAKSDGRKTTLGSVKQVIYKARQQKPKPKSKKKSSRALAKDEVIQLAHIGAKHQLAYHQRQVVKLQMFIKGV